MKKKYIAPVLEVVDASPLNICQSSPVNGITLSSESASGKTQDARDRGSRNSDSFEDLW